jgi:hypothetical protein
VICPDLCHGLECFWTPYIKSHPASLRSNCGFARQLDAAVDTDSGRRDLVDDLESVADGRFSVMSVHVARRHAKARRAIPSIYFRL